MWVCVRWDSLECDLIHAHNVCWVVRNVYQQILLLVCHVLLVPTWLLIRIVCFVLLVVLLVLMDQFVLLVLRDIP